MMRIRVVVTDPTSRSDLAARAAALAACPVRSSTRVAIHATRLGPASTGTPYDSMLADLGALDAAMSAVDDGDDAVVLDDPGEPAIDALRSRCAVPVTGPVTAAVWLGRLLGLPVTLVAAESHRAAIERALLLAEVDERTAFVVTFPSDEPESSQAAIERAVQRGAATIVLCGPEADATQSGPAGSGVPVIGATVAAILLAEAMADLSLRQSPAAWLPPAVVQDDLVRTRLADDPAVSVPIRLAPRDDTRERRIRVIVPHSDMDDAALARRSEVIVPGLLRAGTTVSYTGTRTSPNRADSPYASFLMDAFCFEQGLQAAAGGVDALTIDSTTDSGIPALRSRLPILVVGTGSATWALAAAISHRFSIVAMEQAWTYFYDKNLKLARLRHALASVEVVGTPTDPFNLFAGKEDAMFARLEDLARRAVEERGAEAIIIGSTTMHQASDHLTAALSVPVLNPGRVALRTIEALLALGASQSRVSAPMPGTPHDDVFA